MFINYFAGPGLVRLYWLELLTETDNAGKKHRERQEPRPHRGRTLGLDADKTKTAGK